MSSRDVAPAVSCALERERVEAELQRGRAVFAELVASAGSEVIDQPTNGTRWTNKQLLFHMLFGYMIVVRLIPLVKVLSRLPPTIRRAFAAVLDSATPLFNSVNYWGSVGGSRLYPPDRLPAKFDAVTSHLQRRLRSETSAALKRSTNFPTRWDPFFTTTMTLADVYHYPTQHFDFHQHQLALAPDHAQRRRTGV
jgi:hypothetical protein